MDPSSDVLRAWGLRVTPQRVAVLEAVRESRKHLSAEEVYAEVRRRIPTVSLGTVYKALGELRDLGHIRALQVSGKLRFDAGQGPHSHLVCKRCHRIEDVSEVNVELGLTDEERRGYEVLGVEVSFWGICPDCREHAGTTRASNTRAKVEENGKGP